ncbi:MAG: 3-deoxy-D-manno-octulosonic-acid transferase [Bacteroidia bacterium]
MIYSLGIKLYGLGIRVLAFFSPRIRAFYAARSHWYEQLSFWRDQNKNLKKKVLCFHCSSLGEYEMAIPILANPSIRNEYYCVVTFFSPSGYNHSSLGIHFDAKFYLPLDTIQNMRQFTEALNPSKFVFVKNDLWFNLIRELNKQGITTYWINGKLKEGGFSSGLGKALLKNLRYFEKCFVQDQTTSAILKKNNIDAIITNDLRYDRSIMLRTSYTPMPLIKEFKGKLKILIAGSSWPDEEAMICKTYMDVMSEFKLLIVPHDVSAKHIHEIKERFEAFDVALWTDSDEEIVKSNVLVINKIGILSNLYQYADIAFIGGAFGKGLHNILEAATAGMPIITGPNTKNFPEVSYFKQAEVLFEVNNASELQAVLNRVTSNPQELQRMKDYSRLLVESKTGSTAQIVQCILD